MLSFEKTNLGNFVFAVAECQPLDSPIREQLFKAGLALTKVEITVLAFCMHFYTSVSIFSDSSDSYSPETSETKTTINF